LGGSSKRKRYVVSCRNEFVHYDEDYTKRIFALKRVVYSDGYERVVPIAYDEGYAKGLFAYGHNLGYWVCPRERGWFRSKWSSHKPKRKGGGKRKLSPQLAKARALTESVFSDEVLAKEFALASSYCAEKSNQVIVLKAKDSDEVIGLNYPYRFSVSRVSKVKKRFRENVKPNLKRCKDFLFMTLTIRFRGRFKSQREAYDYVRDRWDDLWSVIHKRFKWAKMVRSFEWQKNGMGIHVHALICGLHWLNANWVRKLWGEPNKRSVELKTVRNWKQAYYYVMKYALKDVRADEGQALDTSQVVNLAIGARAYGISRSLSSLGFIKHNSDFGSSDGWVFLGVLDLKTFNSLPYGELLRYFGYG